MSCFSCDNHKLASCCQSSGSACCKSGKIFLPVAQYEKIVSWIQSSSPEDLEEFQKRCEKHDDFYLYDQQSQCQFLDEKNLCRLHTQGVKPSECYWWPLHVYVESSGKLEIRSASYCCGGEPSHDEVRKHIQEIEKQAEEIGHDVIRVFRQTFPGSKKYRSLKILEEDAEGL